MSNIERIRLKIQELRESMQSMILSSENLLAPEVIRASKMLDEVLNEYEDMLRRKK